MRRKELIPYLVNKFGSSNLFKDIYKYVAPPFNIVTNFPSLAITYNETQIDNKNSNSCSIYNRTRDVYLNLVVYNKASNKNIKNYEDSLGDLLDNIEQVLDEILNENNDIINIEIVKIKEDEGIIYPHQVALLLIKFKI